MHLRLSVHPGGQSPYVWQQADATIRVGRSPECAIRFDRSCAMVSWEHAQIAISSAGAEIRDLGATNGTFVNGRRIEGVERLRAGDRIGLGLAGPELIVESIGGSDSVETLVQAAALPPAATESVRDETPPELPSLRTIAASVVVGVLALAVLLPSAGFWAWQQRSAAIGRRAPDSPPRSIAPDQARTTPVLSDDVQTQREPDRTGHGSNDSAERGDRASPEEAGGSDLSRLGPLPSPIGAPASEPAGGEPSAAGQRPTGAAPTADSQQAGGAEGAAVGREVGDAASGDSAAGSNPPVGNESAGTEPASGEPGRDEPGGDEAGGAQPEAASALAGDRPPADLAALPAHVMTILRDTCHRCHGEGGSSEGGFNFVMHPDRLRTRGLVAPGDAEASPLWQRIHSREMPPEGEEPQLSESSRAAVQRWIESGAAAWEPTAPRPFIGLAEQAARVAGDLAQRGERDRPYTRYFTLTHLYNAGLSEDELQTLRNAVSKLINSLSWNPRITPPQPIDPEATILRIDLRDYEWDRGTWDQIVGLNPYAMTSDCPDEERASRLAETRLPFVRGDWFVFRASRPPLYERVLKLPATERGLESILRIDVVEHIRAGRAVRVGFNQSGVSQNNRLLERHDTALRGSYWKSYDFSANRGRQNIFQHPLGPAEALPRGRQLASFEHAGGELIFNLPNGLQAYMLVDGSGNRIDKGPTEIVSDPNNRADRTVVNGISCISCHYGGIIKKEDEIRPQVEAHREAFPHADEILALYPPQEVIDRLMDEDAQRFRLAVEATGSTISREGEPIVRTAQRFEDALDARLAAAELGLEPAEFLQRVRVGPAALVRALGVLAQPRGTVKREVFTDLFAEAVRACEVGRPLSLRGS